MNKITEHDFVTTVNKEAESMFKIAYAILNNKMDAEDAVSASLLKAWKNIESLRNPAELKNWLLSIVVNESKNMYKKRKRENNVEDISKYIDTAAVNDEVCDEDSDILYVVKSLKWEYRIVIIMYYYNEMSVKEIAKTLGISNGTVKSRLSRARNKLKHILEGNGR